MNTKASAIAAGAVAGILALSACGADTYEYEVSGAIVAKQVDYDCPDSLSLGLAAFSKSKRKSSSGGTVVLKKKTPTPAAPKPNPSSSPTKTGSIGTSTQRSGSPAPSASHPKVTLHTKPVKPHRVKGGVPKLRHPHGGKGCETEYELFLGPEDNMYEQDVPADTYDTCAVDDQFPDCITQD